MVKIPLLVLILPLLAAAADYNVGVARLIITPEQPMYLSGYANRTHASEGKVHDLWAKALVIEDRKGGRVVILSAEVVGLPRGITDVVAARLAKEYGIDRARLVINSSHTHTGPFIRGNLSVMFELDPVQQARVDEYGAQLIGKLVAVAAAAINDLSPANLWFGNGTAKFAANRRAQGGPSDQDVPILKATAPDGKLRAVVFGYACHNTTLTGDFYRFSGDYAGFAQLDLEQANPGATALFLMLCGADQNPKPRGTLDQARQHGADLAAEAGRVLSGRMQPVRGAVVAAFQSVDLAFAIHTRETFESRLAETNVFRVRHAKAMLATYDQGRPIRRYSYPVQAVAFGKDLTIVALGGEVVVDYALRIKKEYGAKGIIVAGYSNDVMSYIPSLRVLKGGGYEAAGAMIYYGLPGPYNDDVEDDIMRTVGQVMKRVKRPAAR